MNINALNRNNETILLQAIKHNYYNIAEFLIKRGANYNIPDKLGITPLHAIAINTRGGDGESYLLKLLLQKGALTELKDCCDWTPLQIAMSKGKIETIKLLIQYRAKLNPELSSNHFSSYRDFKKLIPANKPDLKTFLKLVDAWQNYNIIIINDYDYTIKDINELLDWQISISPTNSNFFPKHLNKLYYLKIFLLNTKSFKESEFIEKIDTNLNLYGTLKNSLIFKIIENPKLYNLNALPHDLIDQLKNYGLELAGDYDPSD